MRSAATAVIDVHAHFFNASDVPVRGFISDCLGHNAPLIVRPLITEMAALAEKLSTRAPTAFEELQQLKGLVHDNRGRSARDTHSTCAYAGRPYVIVPGATRQSRSSNTAGQLLLTRRFSRPPSLTP